MHNPRSLLFKSSCPEGTPRSVQLKHRLHSVETVIFVSIKSVYRPLNWIPGVFEESEFISGMEGVR